MTVWSLTVCKGDVNVLLVHSVSWCCDCVVIDSMCKGDVDVLLVHNVS